MQPTLPPTYKLMLEAIGQQISERKGALMKRTLLITWPYILLVIAGYVSKTTGIFETMTPQEQLGVIFISAIIVVLILFYTTVVSFIFKIEKQIWIDSFFDQKNLTLQESWKIAMKLFWPAISFRVKLWSQFYFIPIIIVIVSIGGFIYVTASQPNNYETIMMTWLIVFLIVAIGIVIYGYFIKIKLRYSWFIFLDKYGVENSYGKMVDEMKRLNEVSKSETFKKSLIANIGTDSVNIVTNLAVSAVGSGLSHFGNAGKAVGQVVEIYGKEMARQTADLGNIAAQYILYRFARKEAFGQEQEVNETLYNLK